MKPSVGASYPTGLRTLVRHEPAPPARYLHRGDAEVAEKNELALARG